MEHFLNVPRMAGLQTQCSVLKVATRPILGFKADTRISAARRWISHECGSVFVACLVLLKGCRRGCLKVFLGWGFNFVIVS